MDKKELEHLRTIDSQIVEAAKNVKVLTRLSWPTSIRQQFLSDWRQGNPKLPQVEYAIGDDLLEASAALTKASNALKVFDNPLSAYLGRTADSYRTLCRLLSNAGKPEMLEASRELYGAPGDLLADGKLNNLEAAHHFLDASDQYYQALHLQEADYCLPAKTLQQDMLKRLSEVFPEGTISIEIDADLVSKAAAGATRIRLRGDTCFTDYDLEQLLQHEAFIHSLTALNGRAQENVKCFGLSAPRTTGSQEGLATFAEVITGATSIDRLERIALRIVAIDHALNGADFLEVFQFFLDKDQPEDESFNSTMRVFRGAPLTGGYAFTKDGVYLHGLMEMHTFFRWAMSNKKLDLCRHLFAGRMTISDVIDLEPLFADGTIQAPKYLPPWMAKAGGLAGYLAFSIFANKISIGDISEHHQFKRMDGLT